VRTSIGMVPWPLLVTVAEVIFPPYYS